MHFPFFYFPSIQVLISVVQIFRANTQEVDPSLIKKQKFLLLLKKNLFTQKFVMIRLPIKVSAKTPAVDIFYPRDFARGTATGDTARKELERSRKELT